MLQKRVDAGEGFGGVECGGAGRDAVRRELADAYLGQGMSFAEISFLLGFAEPSAFFRAFKRWTGVTPLERKVSLGAT